MDILFVDDDQILCTAFSEYLEGIAPKLTSKCIKATPVFTLEAAIDVVCSDQKPDLVFLDLNLGGRYQGYETIKYFYTKNTHKIPVVIFTGLRTGLNGNIDILRKCLTEFNVRGILKKDADIKNIFVGLSRIFEDEFWIPQDIFMELASTAPQKETNSSYHLGLTPSEWEVAKLLTEGLRDKEIARKLDRTHDSIRQSTSIIYEKLGVNNRTKAAIIVHEEIKSYSDNEKNKIN